VFAPHRCEHRARRAAPLAGACVSVRYRPVACHPRCAPRPGGPPDS